MAMRCGTNEALPTPCASTLRFSKRRPRPAGTNAGAGRTRWRYSSLRSAQQVGLTNSKRSLQLIGKQYLTRTEITRRLHEMVDERLFGDKSWPADKESADEVNATLLELGLIARTEQSFRNTPLGDELHLDLLEAFMGFWDEFELLEILEMRGLIKEEDLQQLRKILRKGAGWEATFKGYVRRAYSQYFNPTHSLVARFNQFERNR